VEKPFDGDLISLLLTWLVQVLYSLEKMMPAIMQNSATINIEYIRATKNIK